MTYRVYKFDFDSNGDELSRTDTEYSQVIPAVSAFVALAIMVEASGAKLDAINNWEDAPNEAIDGDAILVMDYSLPQGDSCCLVIADE